MPAQPAISVVIPSRNRAGYLGAALERLAAQELDEPYEVIVVDDGSTDGTQELLAAAGVLHARTDPPRGPNAARNRGAAMAGAPLVVLIDDDVRPPPRWLAAYLDGAERHPEAEAFGGPIWARLDGPAPRGCGREPAPITTLDLGAHDAEAEFVWSANMMVRRSALERIGGFDESIVGGGEEEDWLRRLHAAGGRAMYLAGAGLEHRRAGDDVRLRSLMRASYRRGRSMRAYDALRGGSPSLARELRVLSGCGWHTLRRACPQGLIMGAHSAGRVLEAVRRG